MFDNILLARTEHATSGRGHGSEGVGLPAAPDRRGEPVAEIELGDEVLAAGGEESSIAQPRSSSTRASSGSWISSAARHRSAPGPEPAARPILRGMALRTAGPRGERIGSRDAARDDRSGSDGCEHRAAADRDGHTCVVYDVAPRRSSDSSRKEPPGPTRWRTSLRSSTCHGGLDHGPGRRDHRGDDRALATLLDPGTRSSTEGTPTTATTSAVQPSSVRGGSAISTAARAAGSSVSSVASA